VISLAESVLVIVIPDAASVQTAAVVPPREQPKETELWASTCQSGHYELSIKGNNILAIETVVEVYGTWTLDNSNTVDAAIRGVSTDRALEDVRSHISGLYGCELLGSRRRRFKLVYVQFQ
jgi:hypothetical protein